MKFRNLLFPILCITALASCNNNTDPYRNKLEKDSERFTFDGEMKLQYNNNEVIDKGNLVVKFDGQIKDYYAEESNLPNDVYFFTTSNEAPIQNRLTNKSQMGTSKPTYTTNVYIAIINSSDDKAYISKPKQITITNSQALNPVLYYVGGAVIVVGCVLLIYFAKRYKEKHSSTK